MSPVRDDAYLSQQLDFLPLSKKQNCWDNAIAKSFFKTLKTELIYQTKFQTKKETELYIFEYIKT